MNDLLLKCTFGIGLLLIIFHSIIFHLIRQDEKLIQRSNQVNNQSINRSKNINQPLTSKMNNRINRRSQTISNKKPIYKNTKNKRFAQPVISRRKNKQELSDKYIETVLNGQKMFFKTCYIRHLKNNLASKGSILLSFNIDSPGMVSDVSIQGGSMKDITLHKCMKKVVERVTFRHFSGPLTKVFYPIEFH